MNRTLLISLVVVGVLVLAAGGWIFRGARWASRFVRPVRGRRPAFG
jgi:hypothetical protein